MMIREFWVFSFHLQCGRTKDRSWFHDHEVPHDTEAAASIVLSNWIWGRLKQEGTMVTRRLSTTYQQSLSQDPVCADDKSFLMGLGGWQLHRSNECPLGQRLEGLEIGLSALHWLRTYRKDTLAMTSMRNVLLVEGSPFPVSHLREEDIIEQVAHLVKSGVWHVCEPVMRVYNVLLAQEPAIMTVPRGAFSRPTPPPPVSDIPDPATLARNADQAAIAAVLTQSAIRADAFCEECARAARR